MDKLKWCKKKKRGIELIEPNNNLCEEYFNKAEKALQATKSLKGIDEWQISSAYYAMYFSLYAILMKSGIKSEIHDCTIEIMKKFFSDYFIEKEISLIKNSLKARINAQYYIDKDVEESQRKEIVNNASKFHLKCKEVSINISQKEINYMRERLEND